MKKFILVDPGTTGIGGPRLAYVRACLQAAEAQGFQPFAVMHHRFQPAVGLWESSWETLPLFAEGTDREEPLDYLPRECEQLIQAVTDTSGTISMQGPQRQAATFLRGCRQWLSRLDPQLGDQIFVPFAHPFHLLGLGKLVKHLTPSQQATWHVQFHLDLARGELDFSDSSRFVLGWRPLFLKAAQLTRGHDVRLYTPHESLTAQYQALRAGNFQTLPLPLQATSLADDVRRPRTPLRLLCVGKWDSDWSRQQFSRVLLDLWQDELTTGRLRLLIWNTAQPVRSDRPAGSMLAHGTFSQFAPPLPGGSPADHPLEIIGTPPDAAAYRQWIRSIDAGLLLCPPTAFRHRAHGLLWDLVGEGVPLILPPETWTMQQLSQADPYASRIDKSPADPNADRAAVPDRCLAAVSPQLVPALIRDVMDHYPAYRKDAMLRARALRRQHSAVRLLHALTHRERTLRKASSA